MRKVLIAFTVATLLGPSMVANAGIGQLSPRVDAGNPALETYSGRASLCRAHLLTSGYPHAYLYNTRRSSRGLVGACARQLYAAHRDQIRRLRAARLANR